MTRKIFFLLLLLITTNSILAQVVKENRLFRFERSTNDNIVCYDVNHTNGKLNVEKPILVYWSNLGNQYSKTGDLSFFERKFVFGYNIRKKGNNEATFVLRASSKKVMRVEMVNGKWRATTDISKRKAYVTRMYVKMKSAMTAEYLDIFGKDIETGEDVSERLKN